MSEFHKVSVDWLRLGDFIIGMAVGFAIGAALVLSLQSPLQANNNRAQNLRGLAKAGTTEEAGR